MKESGRSWGLFAWLTCFSKEDSIEIGGEVFEKPFVEKPINSNNHNIYIYYHSKAGGGSKRLFRKVGNKSRFGEVVA